MFDVNAINRTVRARTHEMNVVPSSGSLVIFLLALTVAAGG